MTDPFADLASFEAKPKTPRERRAPRPLVDDEKAAVREVAEEHGFVVESHGPPARRYFRKPGAKSAPTMNASMRVRIEDWNRFQAWCAANRYNAREGFEALVANLPET